MFELPLFPLNTVLFPGMPLHLHIFEERYKLMIRNCLQTGRPFGVVMIRDGQEAEGPLADPYRVGCTARILEVEHLPEGKMNLLVMGEKRFRIDRLKFDQPYLVGEVEFFPLQDSGSEGLLQTSDRLRSLVKEYMQILSRLGEVNLKPQNLPQDPLVLAYLAAVLVRVPQDEKQDLLASQKASDFLSDMHTIYRKEVPLLRAAARKRKPELQRGFSMN